MMNRLVHITLTLLTLSLLGTAIYAYGQTYAALRENGLDGMALLALIFLGIFALIMPFHLRQRPFTTQEMVVEYLRIGGMMIGVVVGITAVFALIILIITLPQRLGAGWLILPWLTLLVPLAMALIDFAKGNIARTPASLLLGFVTYLYQIYGMLLIQFITIPIAFALFPTGFLLQFLSIADAIARSVFNIYTADLPLLCNWFNLDGDTCTPALIGLHVGHLVLAWLAVRYGQQAVDQLSDWYAQGLHQLTSRLEQQN